MVRRLVGESLWRGAALRKVTFVALLLCACIALGPNIYADEGEGGWSDSTSASCADNAYDDPCLIWRRNKKGETDWTVSGAEGGGASWRIFKAVDNVNGLDDYTGYGGGILQGKDLKKNAINDCKSDGWLVSYGWDGMHGSAYGYADFNFQIGPASRVKDGEDQAIKRAVYNNHGVVKLKDLDNNGFRNNVKITQSAALILYNRFLASTGDDEVDSIPLYVGYFCSKPNPKSFQGLAAVSQGGYENATIKNSTGWVASNKSVNINLKCPDGGCTNAKYFLKLKLVGGDGDTTYRLGYNAGNGASTTWDPKKGYNTIEPTSNDDGTQLLKTGSSAGAFSKVLPGAKVCHSLEFKPYGNLSSSTLRTVSSCATGLVTTFEGYSGVSGAASGSTGWGNGSTNNLANVKVVNCSASSGCEISFSHHVRTSDNKGTTRYHIERTSNATSDELGDRKITNNGNFNGGSVTGPLTSGKKVSGSTLRVYPGMKVCEKLVFETNNDSTKIRPTATREVCVYVEGNARDVGDSDYLNMKVRNNDVDKFNELGSEAYAKPGDHVDFVSSYNPQLQYAYYLTPEFLKITGDGQTGQKYNNPSGSSLGALFNSKMGSGLGWNNGYGVVSENFFSTGFNKSYTGDVGSVTPIDKSEKYTVSNNEVGRTLKGRAQTNIDTASGSNKTTPKQVSFSYAGSEFLSTVNIDSIGNDAAVKVPYNFTTKISVDDFKANEEVGKPVLAAGESSKINVSVEVNPKKNGLTMNRDDKAYATKTDAKIRFIVFAPGDSTNLEGDELYGTYESSLCGRYSGNMGCYTMTKDNEISETLNQEGNTEGYKGKLKNDSSFTVPDFDAGVKVCVAAAIYPSTSGSDDNLKPEGDDKWNISEAKCFAVYKKPSLQVWGANVFSAGGLSTPAAEKKHVRGLNNYNIASTEPVRIFGSFGELGVVSLGEVRGFSSGAATGYASNNGGVLSPNPIINSATNPWGNMSVDPGGFDAEKYGSSFCERSKLTFANTSEIDRLNCVNSTPGLGGSGLSSATSNRSSLVATFVNMDDAEAERKNVVVIRPDEEADQYVLQDEDKLIGKGTTRVIYAQNKDVVINDDILYEDNYESLTDVPKMIIYANNILINCDVGRVDAVLIAEEVIDTCADLDGADTDGISSRQLIINGSTIANKIDAKRTYGAATGANSVIPAEIINYDTTLYLWGSDQADVTESGKLDTVYKRDLAPRR